MRDEVAKRGHLIFQSGSLDLRERKEEVSLDTIRPRTRPHSALLPVTSLGAWPSTTTYLCKGRRLVHGSNHGELLFAEYTGQLSIADRRSSEKVLDPNLGAAHDVRDSLLAPRAYVRRDLFLEVRSVAK